jgi:hypothetical protein
MYYPYLRGRQYELIALRELLDKDLIGDKIIPLVEPVKASPTLLSFLKLYTEKGKVFGIVQNPKYGTFFNEMERSDMDNYKERYFSFFHNYDCLKPVYVFNKKIHETKPLSIQQKSIAVCADENIIQSNSKLAAEYNVEHFLIPDKRVFKRGILGNRILMADNFKKQQRNVDYGNSPDEFFSDDHLHFKNEGYIGFSDFSIIGDDYTESGFAPLAVAIHMVYFDSSKNLQVHHFVSDSNVDYNDPAGKFGEALKKLVDSSLLKKSNTYAYKEFQYFYDNGIYSGLGVVKKLSLMHHIELISHYLENQG